MLLLIKYMLKSLDWIKLSASKMHSVKTMPLHELCHLRLFYALFAFPELFPFSELFESSC